MGLLDQVLGQVLGRMGGGGSTSGPPHGRTPGPSQGGGAANPLLLAILALVASRVLDQGAGGLGSKLRDLVTGGHSATGGHADRGGLETSGLPGGGGILGGDRPHGGGSSDGGFLDDVGAMLDRAGHGAPGGVPPQGPGGGMYGDGLAPGGLGGLVGSGLGGLLERFRQNGHGDAFSSWVGPGANEPISPEALRRALGDDTIDALARETGLPPDDLLGQLSQALPEVVDGLTPDGRLPDPHEESRWV